MKKACICALVLLLLLAACSTGKVSSQTTSAPVEAPIAEEPITAQPTAVPTPNPTVPPTPEPTPEPTPTPESTEASTPEPTPTPTPEPTPEPTPTPEPPLQFRTNLVLAYQRGTATLEINRNNNIEIADKTHLEIRLEDGTVVGEGTYHTGKKNMRIGIQLPDPIEPRTRLYLYMDGVDYPIDTKDIGRIDNGYDKVWGNYDREDSMIALTFDCAYGDKNTEWLLDTLLEYNIPVTFFMTGEWIENYGNWVERIINTGYEVGNHTYSHPHLSKLSDSEMDRQIRTPMELLLENHGYRTHLFRPPYGWSNLHANATCRFYGMEVIRWGQTTRDSNEKMTAQQILDKVFQEIKPGDIILCHNDAKQLQNYLRPMLDELIARGYTFCTVSELMGWEWEDTYTAREQMQANGDL